MKIEDFVKIFYSNYQPSIDWAQMEEILWMFNEDLFKLEKVQLASNSEFLNFIANIEKQGNKIMMEDGDSISHRSLKLIAADFLINNFGILKKDILFEQSFVGFEVDVIDRSLTLPIECGDTNALKIEYYLTANGVKYMVIVPYPHTGDVFAYLLTAQPKFKDYVLFKRDYLRKKITHR